MTSILYYFLVFEIYDKEKKNKYKTHTELVHEGAGAYIDNKAKNVYNNPEKISEQISKNLMKEVLSILLGENISNKKYEVNKKGMGKLQRRSRKIFEKLLIYFYFRSKVPVEHLNNTFWIEHIFPFSSKWEGEIDIDRLGNIIPIIDHINKERRNKHICDYKNTNNFLQFIDIIPSIKEYNFAISHNNTKIPHIYDNEKFNSICVENENKLINCFLQFL